MLHLYLLPLIVYGLEKDPECRIFFNLCLCVLHYLLKHTTLSLSPPGRLCNVLSESLYLLHGALPPYHERTVVVWVGGWGWWAHHYTSLPLTIPFLLPRLCTVRLTSQCNAVKKLSFVHHAGSRSLVQAPLVDVL